MPRRGILLLRTRWGVTHLLVIPVIPAMILRLPIATAANIPHLQKTTAMTFHVPTMTAMLHHLLLSCEW